MNAFARPKLALFWAAVFVSLAPFELSAQETRKDVVVKVPLALEAAIAESHEALRKILNGDPSGYAALFADHDVTSVTRKSAPTGSSFTATPIPSRQVALGNPCWENKVAAGIAGAGTRKDAARGPLP